MATDATSARGQAWRMAHPHVFAMVLAAGEGRAHRRQVGPLRVSGPRW
jgi:hypothetical protein